MADARWRRTVFGEQLTVNIVATVSAAARATSRAELTNTMSVAVEKALGSSNRQGVKRISSLGITDLTIEGAPSPQVVVGWTINEI